MIAPAPLAARNQDPPEIADAAVTDVGLVRSANEDAFVRRPDARLWAVADGMGGYQGGDWASAALARSIGAVGLSGAFEADSAALAQAIHDANTVIFDEAERRGARIGSTVAALLLGDGQCVVHWVGDSRVYRLRGRQLTQLTRDHTQVQDRVDRGLLRPDQARAHPMAHVLSRAVGVAAALALDTARDDVRPGDRFILCSDGLHGVVEDHEIASALEVDGLERSCERLLELCRSRGAPDNVTIVAVAAGG